MTTTASSPSAAISVTEPVFTPQEELALAGFLAGYTGLTREAYALDLRQYANWCQQRHLRLFQARRADIECFARDLEAKGRARATITRRLCTIAGFYRYAVEEDLLDHSPAAHVRRPRLDYESHAIGLDRNELGAMLVAAGLGTAAERAISLLALNRLRVSKATGAEHRGAGHGTGSPYTDHHPHGWQGCDYPAGATDCAGRLTWRSASAVKGRFSLLPVGGGWTGTALPGSCAGWSAAPGSPSP